MSKLIELLKQLNIEPTPTKIFLFKQWVRELLPKERKNFPQRTAENLIDEGFNQCRAETLKNIEEKEDEE